MTSSTIEWPGMRSAYAVLAPHGESTVTGANQIGVAFSGHRRFVREVGGRAERTDAPPGSVYVTAGESITWHEVRDPTEALELYPDLSHVARLTGERVDLRPAFAVRDATIFALACLIRRVHANDLVLTSVEASAITTRVIERLVAGYGGGRLEKTPSGRLPTRDVDLIGDYVAADPAGVGTIDDLARLVGLSPFHFARSFRASTGMAPHAFVTAHRLVIAKDMTLRSDAPVPDIATSVGFVNVSHFRRLFKRAHGCTPAQLRRPD